MTSRRAKGSKLYDVVVFSVTFLIMGLWVLSGGGKLAYAFDGGPHAGTFRTWATGASPIGGFDPHETMDDVTGLTNHVGAPANYTSAENTAGGCCGPIYWNQVTNAFKTYCVTGGFQFAGDLNRGAVAAVTTPATPGGGDTWATVRGNSSFSPYVNFRGSDNFARWDVSAGGATAVRVNSATGKVYLGNSSPAEIIELEPITGAVKKWATGNTPYFLVLDGTFVYATAPAGGGHPDQILRLDTGTNTLLRWNVPGVGNFTPCCPFGTPNFITRDAEGNIWFTQSASDQIGKLRAGPDNTLGTADDVIDEYTKAGVDNPHAIASSGSGATLQSFFTEAPAGQQVSVLTNAAATPTSTTVAPTSATVTPTTTTAARVDFTVAPITATITPVVTPVVSTNGSGIDRFPIPPGTSAPTGMTQVAFPNTVLGSMEGSDHVFEFTSEVIVAPPPGNSELSSVGTAQFTLRQERPGVPDDQLVEVATFTLPAGGAIDPVSEAVMVELSEPVCGGMFSSLSLPAGSFAARAGGKIFLANAVVADGVSGAPVTAAVRITRERGQDFKVSLDFKDADYTCLEGTDHRKVTTTLVVGDDTMVGKQCFERLPDGDLFFPPGPGVVCP